MRVFDHATAGGDGGCRNDGQVRIGGANTFSEDELHVLVETDGAGGNTAIGEAFAEGEEGAFVFLPGQDVRVTAEGAGVQRFAGAVFLKMRADQEWLALGGDDEGPKTFAAVESQVGEVNGRCGGVGQYDRVDFCGGHEGLGAVNAGKALGVGEGMREAGEDRQCSNGGG